MTGPYSDEEIGGLGSGPRYPLRPEADAACIDCHSYYGGFPRRYVGVCDDGPVNVCQSCYEQRLFDHIDHYRPQS